MDKIIAKGQPVASKKSHQTGEWIKGRAQNVIYDAAKQEISWKEMRKLAAASVKASKSAIIIYRPAAGEIEAKGDAKTRVRASDPAE